MKEHKHTGWNVEEWTQDLKVHHHSLTIRMKLGRCHVQMSQHDTLKSIQWKGHVQDLEHAMVDVEERGIA